MASLGTPETGPWGFQAPAEWGNIPSRIPFCNQLQFCSPRASFPGRISRNSEWNKWNGTSGREPPGVEGDRMVEDERDCTMGVEAVLAPLMSQMCLYRANNGPVSCLSPFLHWPRGGVSWRLKRPREVWKFRWGVRASELGSGLGGRRA